MQEYRVDVSPIVEDLGASVEVDGKVSLDRLTVGEEEFVLNSPVSFSVVVTNTGPGIVASGTVRVEATAECSRCLEPFDLVIEGDVEGFYITPGHEDEIPEEQEVEPIGPEDTIDLAPALLAALTLEAPFAPLHDEQCAGLCPMCGCNLNEEACSCLAEEIAAGPLASLRELLGDHADDR